MAVDLELLKRLLAAATPGLLKAHPNHHCPGPLKGAFVDAPSGRVASFNSFGLGDGKPERQIECEANAKLYAALRNAAPALIEELESAREDAARYRWIRQDARALSMADWETSTWDSPEAFDSAIDTAQKASNDF